MSALIDLLDNRQMPDHATVSMTLRELREARAEAIAAERARILEAEEGLPTREGFEYADEYRVGWSDHRAAIRAIIGGSDDAD